MEETVTTTDTQPLISEKHESDPDLLMARALGVCWHSPTADRWPCGERRVHDDTRSDENA